MKTSANLTWNAYEPLRSRAILGLALGSFAFLMAVAGAEFQPLFPKDGEPQGWAVREWNDVSKAAAKGVAWTVKDGTLNGSVPRGTWLVSEREYGDFVLEFEWKLGERGNSGCGLRFPLKGDPAFDGLEVQMVDPRYYGEARPKASELTGSLYLAIAPRVQVFRPLEWNRYEITCQGSKVQVALNGEIIQDVNLDEHSKPVVKNDQSEAPPLKDRPRRGHIGFQELSRGDSQVQIRNARIKVLE